MTNGHPSSIQDLKEMANNPRRHTERNISMMIRSLQQYGANRGIVIDENNEVLAGNGVVDAAAAAGIDRVKVIEVAGDEIVAVQVSHLTDDEKRRYAVADNRTAELSDWDADELKTLVDDGLSLDMFFTKDEFAAAVDQKVFRPEVDPVASWQDVTELQIDREDQRLRTRFENDPVEIATIECPRCHKEFYVRGLGV